MNQYQFIAKSKNGIDVYFNTESSHVLTHFQASGSLKPKVSEIISNLKISSNNIYESFNINEDIGFSELIPTTEKDEIIYAKRLHRETYTRFAKNRQPIPTSLITLWICKENDIYELKSAWFGPITPPIPGDPWENEQSLPFWLSHALVWGIQEIDRSTITKECPWK